MAKNLKDALTEIENVLGSSAKVDKTVFLKKARLVQVDQTYPVTIGKLRVFVIMNDALCKTQTCQFQVNIDMCTALIHRTPAQAAAWTIALQKLTALALEVESVSYGSWSIEEFLAIANEKEKSHVK